MYFHETTEVNKQEVHLTRKETENKFLTSQLCNMEHTMLLLKIFAKLMIQTFAAG